MGNTPFPDVVFLVADAQKELDLKISYYLTQGYNLLLKPSRFEELTIDTEATGRTNVQFPRASVAGAVLVRNDPT